MQPYYEEAGIVIYHGDCRDVLPALDAGSIDLVFTSPPYNLGNTTGGGFAGRLGHYRKSTGLSGRGGGGKWGGGALARGYGAHSDDMPHEDYVAWQHSTILACWRLLRSAGAIFYNHKPRILDGRLVAPTDYIPTELRPFVRQEIIWARSGGINFSPAFYLPTHERIVIIARREFRLKSKGASGVGDVWSICQEANSPHPAPFPIALPARAIETTAPAVVLDPFAGSGTTLRAAKNAGGRAIGIELEESWCEYAAKRLAQGVLDFGGVA